MQNCPSTANTCPARKWKHRREFREALSTANHKAVDGIAVDENTYRTALLALHEILVGGCDQCVKNTVIWLANDLKWPANRAFQLIVIEERLRKLVH